MAELVDALASGASASNGVKVQVLLSAPNYDNRGFLGYFSLVYILNEPPACFLCWAQKLLQILFRIPEKASVILEVQWNYLSTPQHYSSLPSPS